MRQNDARQLSHDMLEDMRRRAVMAVQEGQSPEAVGKAFGLNRTTIYDWLAQLTQPAGDFHLAWISTEANHPNAER
jgi:transposase